MPEMLQPANAAMLAQWALAGCRVQGPTLLCIPGAQPDPAGPSGMLPAPPSAV